MSAHEIDLQSALSELKEFVTISDLVRIGLFGTNQAALRAVKKGKLPIVKISCHRYVIHKSDLLNFVSANFHRGKVSSSEGNSA